jgi:hypothetical protein
VAAQRLVSQRGGVLFLEKKYHECGECHAPLLLARSVIEEHVAAAHHQLTPAQYNARHMQVGCRYSPSVADPDPCWIRIQSGQLIRIRIRNPDSDPGGQKLPTKVEKN